jgi:hypothetical protein
VRNVKKSLIAIIISILFSYIALFCFLYPEVFNNNQHTSNDEFKFNSLNYKIDNFFLEQQNILIDKLFLIGSSHVGRVNATFIENQLISSYTTFPKDINLLNKLKTTSTLNSPVVYNLAIVHDTPKDRIKHFEKIIESNPKLILYGVGYRDFTSIIPKKSFGSPEHLLPSLDFIIPSLKNQIENQLGFSLAKFTTAGIDSIKAIKEIVGLEVTEIEYKIISDVHEPFFEIRLQHSIILDDIPLKRQNESNQHIFDRMKSYDINEDVKALEKMIQKSQENNIQFIIYTTPHSKYLNETVDEINQEKFILILNTISKKYNVPIYYLHEKYWDEKIWNDNSHVIMSNGGSHYMDLVNIILKNYDI